MWYFEKVFQVLFSAKKIAKNAEKQSLEWFFTKEGKAEYMAANTVAKKTVFFCDYLLKLRYNRACNLATPEECAKLAFFLAWVIDGSSLPYGKYPKILQSKYNPFLKMRYLDLPTVLGELLKDNIDKTEYNFYPKLSFDSRSEEYAIQRVALSIFGLGYAGEFPYKYDIFDDSGVTIKVIEENTWG